MVELTEKSIPDTVCDSEPNTDSLYLHLYYKGWKLKIIFWDFIDRGFWFVSSNGRILNEMKIWGKVEDLLFWQWLQ